MENFPSVHSGRLSWLPLVIATEYALLAFATACDGGFPINLKLILIKMRNFLTFTHS